MFLISSKEILKDAKLNNYAIPAFNFENLEMAQAIAQTASMLKVPVIMQTTPSTVKYIGINSAYGIAEGVAKDTGAKIALHLDHANSLDLVHNAVEAGYTSIMIDGSNFLFNDNISITAKARKICGNIQLEAELGKVGGKEDDLDGGDIPNYTDPIEAIEFINMTKVDSLAIGVGTAHGFYNGVPKLNFKLISHLSGLLNIPLVLHGASGLYDDMIRECVKRGINKVNFATELRAAFTQGVSAALEENKNIIDPKKYLAYGRKCVLDVIKEKVKVCMKL